MKPHKEIFIKNFLEKANIALSDARKNIDNNSLLNAQNRVYYTIFYSVAALGYSENFITSKHTQLMGWFNKKFIHEEKIFDKVLFKIYEKAYRNRMESDYSYTIHVDINEVMQNFKDAELFIKTIENYIKNKS